MKKVLNIIDYLELTRNNLCFDHVIGDGDIYLTDDYYLEHDTDYEFVAHGNSIIEVLQGSGNMTVNSVEFKVKAPCLIAYVEGHNIKVHIDSVKVKQRSAVFSERFISELYKSSLRFSDMKTSMMENPVVHLDKSTAASLDKYIDLIRTIADAPEEGKQVLRAKYATMTFFYGPFFDLIKRKFEVESFRTPKVAADFFDLLEIHVRQEHALRFYADKLNISERYLYKTVTATTGKNPSQWVDIYLFGEAKKLLDNRDLSIMQICGILNFSGLPSFGKFFTRMDGRSPRDYRKLL